MPEFFRESMSITLPVGQEDISIETVDGELRVSFHTPCLYEITKDNSTEIMLSAAIEGSTVTVGWFTK